MSTTTCPICSADRPAEYNFCVSCDKQIKCLNPECNKVLVAGKTFCFTCGQPLASVPLQVSQPNRYYRAVEQKGENYEETTEWNVSDHAVSQLAPFIVDGMTTLRSQQRIIYQARRGGPNAPSDMQTEAVGVQAGAPTQLLPQGDIGVTEPPEQTSDGAEKKDTKEGAARYFVQDGEYLVASHKDFKGKNWAEQQRRFLLLYAAAYQKVFGKPVPSREHFTEAAKRASIIDNNNFSKYLTELSRRELTPVSSGFAIGSDGDIEVNKIIVNIMDEKAEAGYPYWAHGPQSPTTRRRLSNDEKTRIKEWAQEDAQLGGFDIRSINTSRDYAMFALWLITVRLKKADTVQWNDAYYFLKEKFPAITATSNAFAKAIASPNNAKYFRSNEDQYFLSTDGQAEVEKWLAGNSKLAPASASAFDGETTGD